MKHVLPNLRNPGQNPRRAGFALVVALTAIVLITVIVLAFFSKALLNRQVSFTSTNQIKTDMLARTAIDTVVGEIRQEIVDYSTSPTNGIYQPLASSNMIPIRTGVSAADTNAGMFTIAKVAADGTKIDPGANGKVFGSAVTLDQKSRNGRTLSQWFSSGPGLGSANLPTWTYLSRAGVGVTNVTAAEKNPTGTNYVTGRFSYTVYNAGGLLDANVAGYPSTTSASDVGVKSSIAYADLTALGLTTAQINDLVAWRNAATGGSATLFKTWATGLGATNTTASQNAATAAASGHLDIAPGDNAFFSRRDLLRYLSTRATTNAAPSLTHFSRALTAPTWGPANVAGSAISYGDEANDADSINRLVPTVTAFNGVITDYADDGTPAPRAVSASEPLVQGKFSLAKLAWIGHDGPNASAFSPSLSAAQRELAIKTCFGLTWRPNTNPASQTSNAHWEYDHGSNADILILDEVRQQQRAPDFFELLKAGILHGSLGGQPGVVAGDIAAANNNSGEWAGPIGRDFEAYSADEDRHVLQIGANIIDQADANNFPTAIYMDLINKYAGTERQFFNTIFGLENLPMLQRMGVINAMVDNHAASPGPYPVGKMAVWMQPELWNPNEKSTAGTSPSDTFPTPAAIRLTTYGKSFVWNAGENPTDPTGGDPVDFGTDYYNPKIDGIISIKNPSPTSTSPRNFFDNPRVITGHERASAQKNYADTTSVSGPRNRYPVGATWVGTGNASNQFTGVFIGECDRDPNTYPQYNLRPMIDGYLTFVMEYYDGSSWRPYGSLSRLETLHSNSGGSGSRQGSQFILSTDGHIDPRTSRFSGSAGRTATGANTGWGGSSTVRSGPATTITLVGAIGRSGITHAWPHNNAGQSSSPTTQVTFTHNPVSQEGLQYLFDDWAINLDTPKAGKPASQFRYTDPDGVTRAGDSWRADYSTGDGVMTYHLSELPGTSQRRRAVILNRPFRSVGELGYVFRDVPFKTLDLWSAESPDAGLLDLFEVSSKTYAVTAGQVNPSVATPNVMAALFSGAGNQATTNSVLPPAVVPVLAQNLTSETYTSGPLGNPSDLVSRFSESMFTSLTTNAADTSYQNKSYGEAPLRALSSVTSTRTWNLLVDVVAQSGKLAANATGLQDFLVEGERRYWLHIAVDRFTGEIVDQQLEAVYE